VTSGFYHWAHVFRAPFVKFDWGKAACSLAAPWNSHKTCPFAHHAAVSQLMDKALPYWKSQIHPQNLTNRFYPRWILANICVDAYSASMSLRAAFGGFNFLDENFQLERVLVCSDNSWRKCEGLLCLTKNSFMPIASRFTLRRSPGISLKINGSGLQYSCFPLTK